MLRNYSSLPTFRAWPFTSYFKNDFSVNFNRRPHVISTVLFVKIYSIIWLSHVRIFVCYDSIAAKAYKNVIRTILQDIVQGPFVDQDHFPTKGFLKIPVTTRICNGDNHCVTYKCRLYNFIDKTLNLLPATINGCEVAS
jgi:hypothetical protein